MPRKWTARRIGIVLALTLLVVACCYLLDSSREFADTAIRYTKQVIDAVATHPVGTKGADVLPPHFFIDEGCWQLLQKFLRQNSGQYTIAVLREIYDERQHEARIVVAINFPDGHHIPMEYSSRFGLAGCTGE
jgi:hypothetical protein